MAPRSSESRHGRHNSHGYPRYQKCWMHGTETTGHESKPTTNMTGNPSIRFVACGRRQWRSDHTIPSSIYKMVSKGERSRWDCNTLPMGSIWLSRRYALTDWKLDGCTHGATATLHFRTQTLPKDVGWWLSCSSPHGLARGHLNTNADNRLVVEVHKPSHVAHWSAIGRRHNVCWMALVFGQRLW